MTPQDLESLLETKRNECFQMKLHGKTDHKRQIRQQAEETVERDGLDPVTVERQSLDVESKSSVI